MKDACDLFAVNSPSQTGFNRRMFTAKFQMGMIPSFQRDETNKTIRPTDF
jgi:hypothetical protein